MPRGSNTTPRKPLLKFPPGVPPAPGYLDEVAAAEYARVVELLADTPHHLMQVDVACVATYAQAYADVARLTCQVREEGETLVSPEKGTSYLNPKCSALSAAHNRLRESAAKLAFSPYDRTRAGTKPTSAANASPVAAFISTDAA